MPASFTASSSVRLNGSTEKSRRPLVRWNAPAFSPTNGRAITRPTHKSPVSISRAMRHISYSSSREKIASLQAIWNTLSAEV